MRLYRVHITRYPDGSREPGWRPGGNWAHTIDFTRAIGSRTFTWPSARRTFVSADRAHVHARLLESFGATVEVQRSRPVEWPTSSPSRPRIRARTRGGEAS